MSRANPPVWGLRWDHYKVLELSLRPLSFCKACGRIVVGHNLHLMASFELILVGFSTIFRCESVWFLGHAGSNLDPTGRHYAVIGECQTAWGCAQNGHSTGSACRAACPHLDWAKLPWTTLYAPLACLNGHRPSRPCSPDSSLRGQGL